MPTHARLSPASRRMLPVLVAAALFACRADEQDTLRITSAEPLPGSFATIHVDLAGRLWLGDDRSLQRIEAGAPVASVAVAARPRVLGETEAMLFVQAGDRLSVIDKASAAEVAVREETPAGPMALDVRAEFLYRGGRAGEVLIYDAFTLSPVAGWPSTGDRATGIAFSPLGDRLYLALADTSGGGGAILTRDVQTGRILEVTGMTGPVSDLEADASGDLFALIQGATGGAALSLRPRGGELRLRWRRTFRELRLDPPLILRAAADGSYLVMAGGENRTGLRVLDGETGEEVGSLREPPLDASFGPGGTLFLLYDGEVRTWVPRGS